MKNNSPRNDDDEDEGPIDPRQGKQYYLKL